MKALGVALSAALAASILSGCFTVCETEYPSVGMSPLAGDMTNRTVTVRGFEATFTETVVLMGYETVYIPEDPHARFHRPGGFATFRTATEVSRSRQTDAFLERAKNLLEESGFNVMANPADFVVEAKFTGPIAETNADAFRFLWWLGTAFTCDRYGQGWRAKLKIYDNRTGKLVFHHDYEQAYSAMGFSPIPIVGIASYGKTETNYIQSWCLAALTDRMMADVSAFLAAGR